MTQKGFINIAVVKNVTGGAGAKHARASNEELSEINYGRRVAYRFFIFVRLLLFFRIPSKRRVRTERYK